MSSPSSLEDPPQVSLLFGGMSLQIFLMPLAIAFLMDLFLMGMLAVSAAYYWHTFNDRIQHKTLVLLMVGSNIAQSIIFIQMCCKMFVTGFGDVEAVAGQSIWVYTAVLGTETLSIFFAQLFFFERAFALLKPHKIYRRVFACVVILGILFTLGVGLGSCIFSAIWTNAQTDFSTLSIPGKIYTAWVVLGVATDLVLTLTLVLCLLSRRTEWKNTNSKINKIVKWTVEAQSLPLVCGILFLVSYVRDPGGNVCFIPLAAEGKLSAISVLVVLNSRRTFTRPQDDTTQIQTHRSNRLTTKGRLFLEMNVDEGGSSTTTRVASRPTSSSEELDGRDITDDDHYYLSDGESRDGDLRGGR